MSASRDALKRPADFPNWAFETLEIDYHAASRSVWMNYGAEGPVCYTPQLLAEMVTFRESLRAAFSAGALAAHPVRYLVIASNKPGVFNLGGDLKTFAAAIRANDVELLRRYAHACIDLIDSLLHRLELPILTVSAVHGQCLGGAFEAALATDYIIAEETARFALPEVTFNTFPGMGAVSLLTRKLGVAMAEKFILEGRAYSGREMYDIEAIDHLAPDGGIRAETIAWMTRDADNSWTRRRIIAEARRRANAITREELLRITDLWADCSTRITDADLRHMERIVNAQTRLLTTKSGASPSRQSSSAPR